MKKNREKKERTGSILLYYWVLFQLICIFGCICTAERRCLYISSSSCYLHFYEKEAGFMVHGFNISCARSYHMFLLNDYFCYD